MEPRSTTTERHARRSRSRSRSPRRHDHSHSHRSKRPRHDRDDRDHRQHRQHHKSSTRRRSRSRSRSPSRRTEPPAAQLPFDALPLSTKRDFRDYGILFGQYLDLQKGLYIEALDDAEVKGRWKSFVKRWNRGDLAEGWYDPTARRRAQQQLLEDRDADAGSRSPRRRHRRPSPTYEGAAAPGDPDPEVADAADASDSSDSIGPALPSDHAAEASALARRSGPTIPSLQDLELRDELLAEDAGARRADLRSERRLERAAQRERLDELAPRPDAGSFAAKLEKRADARAASRSFASRRSPGAEEVADSDVMGGGEEQGVEGFKRRKEGEARKRSEREVRREEVLRARAAEREERMGAVREKERRTVEMLREIARQRFG